MTELPSLPGYQNIRPIGQGATARVYRAVQVSTGQLVAIKILHTGLPTKDTDQQRFARELRLCAQLHNPHIVRLIDQGLCTNNSPYAVFEYIPGHSLAHHLAQHGQVNPGQAKELMLQVLDALTCAHASGIIHRDLKPQNIMLTQTGPRLGLKILDFGIGAWQNPVQANEPDPLTLMHECLGTPAYCAPEQLRGGTSGPHTDLYAWGLIFVECLTGTPVFTGPTTAEIIHQQLSAAAASLPPFIAQHPLADLLREVLRKDPAQCTTDAGTLYETLSKLNLDDMLPPAYAPGGSRIEQDTQVIPVPGAAESAEMRPLTLLCCKLKIMPTSHEVQPPNTQTLEQLLADKLTACQEVLGRFGGRPANMPGGGLMAYFGHPYHTDQDARLAARASLELRRLAQSWNWELAAQGLRCSLQQAIHSGLATLVQGQPMLSGLSDIALSMLFGASGDQIPTSAASYNLLRDHARFTPSPSPLKREAGGEMPLYLLHSEQMPGRSYGMELLGRQTELETLHQYWHDSTEHSQVVAVLADAGIGKSALVESFARQIRAEGGTALVWHCLPEYQHSALQPVLQGLRQSLGLEQAEGAAHQRKLLHQALANTGVDDPNCFEVLCYWLNVPLADAGQRQHFSPERQKQLLYTALYPLILTQGQQGPLLLVIEDNHWLDSVSLEFIQALPQQAAQGLLLLLTLRPCENAPAFMSWVSHPLPLPPLDKSASLSLAQCFLGQRADDPALVRKLVERSSGVPLFIRELAQMADSHQLDTELPLSLMDILGSRMDALGEAKTTVQWAAVLGHGLDAELLGDLMGTEPARVQTQLHHLHEAGLLQPEQEAAGRRYGFTHALYRDAAYQQITEPQRRKMHQRVAGRLADYPDLAHNPDAGLIARHYAQGHHFSQAAHFALQAVREHLGMALLQQALEMVSDLLHWCSQLPDAERHDVQLQAYELRGQALTHQLGWAHPDVLENVQKTREFMQQKVLLSTHKVKVATLWSLGTFYHVSSQRALVHQVADQLTGMADHLLDDSLAILGHCLHGQGHWIDGRYNQATQDLTRVRERYDPQRHQLLARDYTLDAYVWATATLGLMHWFQGKADSAHQYAAQAIEQARAIQHMPSLGIALMYQAYIHQYEQDRNKTGAVANELLALAQNYGLSAVQGYASALVGWATDDLERITGTLGLLKTLGCLLGLTYLQSMAAEVSLRQGDTARALDLINEGLQMAYENGEHYFLVTLYQQKACCLLRTGALAQNILPCLQRARELSQTQAIRPDCYPPLLADYRDDVRLKPDWQPV